MIFTAFPTYPKHLPRNIIHLGVMAIIIFCAASFGILSRPVDLPALFWPANALLLGVILRFPHIQKTSAFIGAVIGLFAADLLTGNNLLLTTALAVTNITGVITILVLLRFFRLHYKQYNQGLTFFYILILVALGSAISACVAISLIPLTPHSFLNPEYLFSEFILWWSGELQNYILFLPLVLAFPTLKQWKDFYQRLQSFQDSPELEDIIPLFLVVFSAAILIIFHHINALYIPLAALIWAALRYNFFSIALLNFVISLVFFYNLNHYSNQPSTDVYLSSLVSMRIGLLMLLISTLTVCLVSSNQRYLFKQLRFLVEHDSLTQALSRHHFMQSAQFLLDSMQAKNNAFAILMLDLDFFKKINDVYGHQVGDLALKHFVHLTKHSLRTHDLFGRLGGEEFAIVLQDVSLEQAENIAKRIQNSLVEQPLPLEDGQDLVLQLSIGLLHLDNNEANYRLDNLLHYADLALYQAKQEGRNRIHIAPSLS